MIKIKSVIKSSIENYGWHIFKGLSDSNNPSSKPFFYTVGLTELNMPELLFVGGIKPEYAHAIFNDVIESWKEKGVTEGVTYDFAQDRNGKDLPMLIAPLENSKELENEYAVESFDYYKSSPNRVRVSQLIWSDEKGRLPSDKHFSMHHLTHLLQVES